MTPARRLLPALVLASAGILTLAACGSSPAATPPAAASSAATAPPVEQPSSASAEPSVDPSASAPPSPAVDVEPAQPVSGADMAGHIHNLAYDGRQLLLGTHEGLFGQDPGSAPTLLSKEPFDVMGLTRAQDLWFASGHPGAGMDAPSDLGLLQSTDQGRTWTEVSLGGEVDFHRLVTSGDVVVGLNAHDGRLLRSDDRGANWTDLGVPGLYDLAISPVDPAIVLGTTQDGPVRSSDGGATFEPLAGAPLLALLAWSGDTLVGADVDGLIHTSADDGGTWSQSGSLPGQPLAFAATGSTVAALVGDTVLESVDKGVSFAPRITELGGH